MNPNESLQEWIERTSSHRRKPIIIDLEKRFDHTLMILAIGVVATLSVSYSIIINSETIREFIKNFVK